MRDALGSSAENGTLLPARRGCLGAQQGFGAKKSISSEGTPLCPSELPQTVLGLNSLCPSQLAGGSWAVFPWKPSARQGKETFIKSASPWADENKPKPERCGSHLSSGWTIRGGEDEVGQHHRAEHSALTAFSRGSAASSGGSYKAWHC